MENMRIRSSGDLIFEYIVPSSCWTDDTDSHCLLIDLPGFKKDEVRLRADNYGHVIVSGERQLNGNKIIHFQQSFKVPTNSNIEDTSGKMEDEIFYITIPKKVKPVNVTIPAAVEQDKDNANDDISDKHSDVNEESEEELEEEEESEEEEEEEDDDEFHDTITTLVDESSLMDKLSSALKKNRTVVLTAVLAFSWGVLISNRFQSDTKVERSM